MANDFVLKIVNVYAPNSDDPEFFEVINQHIAKAYYDYILICGDLNLEAQEIYQIYRVKRQDLLTEYRSRKSLTRIPAHRGLG